MADQRSMTDVLARHALKLRFSGPTVESNGLDLYDGANSFYGFAQAIQIVTHAYMTKEVVSRATALKGRSFILTRLVKEACWST